MERGPPARGAAVRYSAQLQVSTPGAGSAHSARQPCAELPRALLAPVPSSLVGSGLLWIPQEGGIPAHPWVRSGEALWETLLSSAEQKKKTSFGEVEITCLCRLWVSSVSVLPLLRGFWFQLRAVGFE